MTGKNPLGNSKEPQSYEGLNIIVPVGGWRLVRSTRNPTSNDTKYPIASMWINTSNNTAWLLTSNPGVWSEFAASVAGAIISITGDSGGAELPSAGNFNLLGTANQISVTGSAATQTFSLIGPYTPATYTTHGVLMGRGTSSIVASAAGTSGQVFTSGGAGADGAYQAIGVNSALTNHGVLLGQNNSAFVATTAGTNGQVLVGGTGDPAFATISSAGGIAFTTGNNTLDIHTATGGFIVVNQNTSSATLAAQTMYITNNGASLVTYTLPATVAQGTVIKIVGSSVGGWKVAQNANGFINQGGQVTTVGTGGSISSTSKADSIELTAIDATTNAWIVSGSNGGTLTFV